MRPSVASDSTATERQAFADDVAYYLTLSPRQLPSQYLYDDLGSTLFEAICRLPWYPLARSEQHLLRTHRNEIASLVGTVASVVELGPGSGEKLVSLLAPYSDRRMTVHLVDVSETALQASASALGIYPLIDVVSHQDTYEGGLATMERQLARGRTLAVFLGSNIGNFDPPGASSLLVSMRAALRAGDALLLGADLVKPERELLCAYDDPLAVTAAFNRNLLVRINRELGGEFRIDDFSHRAVWNAEASRVEMHLVSRCQQQVRVRDARIEIDFEPGESIWTESSYKYSPERIEAMLSNAGFTIIEQWVHEGFALTLARA